MKQTFHLSEQDLKNAVAQYVRRETGMNDGRYVHVSLYVNKGDRPGEADQVVAQATVEKNDG